MLTCDGFQVRAHVLFDSAGHDLHLKLTEVKSSEFRAHPLGLMKVLLRSIDGRSLTSQPVFLW